MKLSISKGQIVVLLGWLFLASSACKKDKADDAIPCVGGTGGSTTLLVDLKHHSLQIPSDSVYPDTVWLKYNAVNAGSGYDERKIGNPGDTTITFSNLKCGNYYLIASGYDRSIGFVVHGGLGITIAENEDTVAYTVAVVE